MKKACLENWIYGYYWDQGKTSESPMANGESPDLFIHRLVVRTTSPATGRWFMDSHKLPFPWHLQVEKIFFCANLIIEKLQLVSIFVKNQSYNWFVPFLKESTKISLNKFFWSVMYWQTVIMQTSKIQANQDPMKYYKWHFVKQLEWLLKTLQTTWKQRNSGFSSFIDTCESRFKKLLS